MSSAVIPAAFISLVSVAFAFESILVAAPALCDPPAEDIVPVAAPPSAKRSFAVAVSATSIPPPMATPDRMSISRKPSLPYFSRSLDTTALVAVAALCWLVMPDRDLSSALLASTLKPRSFGAFFSGCLPAASSNVVIISLDTPAASRILTCSACLRGCLVADIPGNFILSLALGSTVLVLNTSRIVFSLTPASLSIVR